MAGTNRARRRLSDVLKRWPSALAVGLVVLTLEGGESESSPVESYGEILPLLPLLYLIVAKLERCRASWPVLIVGITAVFAMQIVDVLPTSVFVVAVALIVLVWSAAGGHLHRPGMLRVQAIGMVGFGAVSLIGLAVGPDLGRYLVGAGWFFHGVWDFVHLRLDRVVVRSYAEWCGVLDVLIAAELIFAV